MKHIKPQAVLRTTAEYYTILPTKLTTDMSNIFVELHKVFLSPRTCLFPSVSLA